ncbi:MAG: signal peptidase II [Candidatus Aegiribacteria sp.]|nr:signal peptidase II [Candidatus Aegiribacteria sp.]
MTDARKRTYGYLTTLAVIGIDQLTKRLALGSLDLHQPVSVIGNFFRFTLAWNQGAAFSMSWGGPMVLTVFTAIAVILIAVFIWRLRNHTTLFFIALGAILGGATGNLLDRFFYGKVIDFIDIGSNGWRWPTFNAADIAITIGGILLVILFRGSAKILPQKDDEFGGS